MSILAATLLGRSVTTSNLDLNSATDKLRNQLRFAQAEAMKRYVGHLSGGLSHPARQYWLFRGISRTSRLTGQDCPEVTTPAPATGSMKQPWARGVNP